MTTTSNTTVLDSTPTEGRATALTRSAGRLLLLAAACCLVGGMAHPIVAGNAHSVASLTSGLSPYPQYLLLVGTVALLIGLPVLVLHFANELGRLGVVGALLYLVGNAWTAMSHLVVEAMVAAPLAAAPATAGLVPADGSLFDSTGFQLSQLVGGPILLIGQVLLGVAIVKSPPLPSWLGILLIVGGVLALVPLPQIAVLTGFLFELPRGLGVAGLAWIMITRRR